MLLCEEGENIKDISGSQMQWTLEANRGVKEPPTWKNIFLEKDDLSFYFFFLKTHRRKKMAGQVGRTASVSQTGDQKTENQVIQMLAYQSWKRITETEAASI